MIDINLIVANNILEKMKEKDMKQSDLADALKLPKHTIMRILNGSRMINAIELVQIAQILNVNTEELTAISTVNAENTATKMFVEKFESEEARNAFAIADELADMIIFHAKVRKNAENMMKPWKITA